MYTKTTVLTLVLALTLVGCQMDQIRSYSGGITVRGGGDLSAEPFYRLNEHAKVTYAQRKAKIYESAIETASSQHDAKIFQQYYQYWDGSARVWMGQPGSQAVPPKYTRSQLRAIGRLYDSERSRVGHELARIERYAASRVKGNDAVIYNARADAWKELAERE